MTCKKCGKRTTGFKAGPGKILPLCNACLAQTRQTLWTTTNVRERLVQLLHELNVSDEDAAQVSDALFWTDERREAWESLPEDYRLFIRAMAHVSSLFKEQAGHRKGAGNREEARLTFVDFPEPVLACIRGCSRAALFSAMGDCLAAALGDFNKLLHVMEIFDYEHFDYTDPPELLASLIARGSPDEQFSVIFEALDVLLGTNGLARIKQIRGRRGNGDVQPRSNKRKKKAT